LAKKKKKLIALERLTRSLALFYPELAGQFICPICLRHYPIFQSERITEAHIIPRAAGGGLHTYACEDCNTKSGTKQDKWLGEYLRLLKLRGGSILHTKHQHGSLEIDGVRVGGTYQITQERGFEVFIRADKTMVIPKAGLILCPLQSRFLRIETLLKLAF
jgi:hypothetical protein